MPAETLEQLVTPSQEVNEHQTWNRKARRKQNRTKNILLHVFCGESRRTFEDAASKLGLAHVRVDVKEDLLRHSTYQHLLLEAARGLLRIILGGASLVLPVAGRKFWTQAGSNPW